MNDASKLHTASPSDADTISAKTEPLAPTDDFVVRDHVLTATGLKYQTSTGRLVVRVEETEGSESTGHIARAEVFLTSYIVRDEAGAADASRPVIFAFNGGPGSSSLWLHLGLLGPRRVQSGDAGSLTPPPYGLEDAPDTILADADIVLIDPVNTGYSRVVTGTEQSKYNGFEADRNMVAEVIRLWTTRENRWLSPKYIVGESYGTLRAVAVAERLERAYGMRVNGLGLVSTVLNLGSVFSSPGNPLTYPLHLPTYAAIAHYYGANADLSLADVVAQAEEFALGDFRRVLDLGWRASSEEYDAVVAETARLTGLSERYVRLKRLRWTYSEFAHELRRDEGLKIGRIDARFFAQPADKIESRSGDDPSMDAITGPYSAAMNHYVRAELGYENDLPYEVMSAKAHPWSYSQFENRFVDVSHDLERLLVRNPDLRVHVDYGYYDGATPHFAAEYVFAQLDLDEDARSRFTHEYYEAGHMMYLHPESRTRQLNALRALVTQR